MTIEEAFAARTASLASVIAIVGAQVYLEELPQSPDYPCVVVKLIDDPTRYHLRGRSRLSRARIQVDALVQKVDTQDPQRKVSDLAAAIDGDGLGPNASGWSGFIGAIGSPPLRIKGCFRVDRRRQYDPDELRVLTMSLDYMVTYTTN